jgi:hypothetical protein
VSSNTAHGEVYLIPVSSTNKTDRHNIAEILLKVALNTITNYSHWLLLWLTATGYYFDLQLLVTTLISSYWLLLWFTATGYYFDLHYWLLLWLTATGYYFDLQLMVTTLIYSYWLLLWSFQTFLMLVNIYFFIFLSGLGFGYGI